MKLNFKDPIYWLIILSVSFFLWGTCQKNKVLELKARAEESQHRGQLDELDQQAKTAGHRADSLVIAYTERRTKDWIDLRALSVRNRAMSENVQKLKKPVQVLIDTLQPLRELIIAYDSLLAGKDTIISHLTLSHEADIVDLEAIIKAREDQILVEATKGHLWEQVAVKVEKEANQQRRRKGFWRTSAAILAGGVLFITIQN